MISQPLFECTLQQHPVVLVSALSSPASNSYASLTEAVSQQEYDAHMGSRIAIDIDAQKVWASMQGYLKERGGIHKAHQDSVPIHIQRPRHWKALVM